KVLWNIETLHSHSRNLANKHLNTTYFSFLCVALGSTISFSFFLLLRLSSAFTPTVSLAVASSLAVLLSILFFFYKALRCMSVLFLLSCGMKEGRNGVITVGAGVVMFYNIKNIFNNLRILADSITCDLESKRVSLRAMPFEFYREAIERVYNESKKFFALNNEIFSYTDKFQCNILVYDKGLKTMVNETKQQIHDVTATIMHLIGIASYAAHIVILVLGISIILCGTGFFVRKFLSQGSKHFENKYITKTFVRYDNSRKEQNESGVLPLNKQERHNYIRIPCLKIPTKECKRVALFLVPVFVNITVWALITFVDLMLYWLIVTGSTHLQELPPLTVPIHVSLTVSTQCLQFGNKDSVNTHNSSFQIHLFDPKCSPKPGISLSVSWISLSIIIPILFLFGFLSSFLIQIKLLLIASFYPDKELERIQYLHSKILRKRMKAGSSARRKALRDIVLKVRHNCIIYHPVCLCSSVCSSVSKI
uniref:Dendrocyte-expressed seven transmembrane protein n=1 Tax=Xenopus tropicalis TaxID=8364 RepID=F6UBS5_XENTR